MLSGLKNIDNVDCVVLSGLKNIDNVDTARPQDNLAQPEETPKYVLIFLYENHLIGAAGLCSDQSR